MKISMMNIVQHRELCRPTSPRNSTRSGWIHPGSRSLRPSSTSASIGGRSRRSSSLPRRASTRSASTSTIRTRSEASRTRTSWRRGCAHDPGVRGRAPADRGDAHHRAAADAGVAEEYAMLDLLSGGRLIAGMPVGTPMDTTLCYGVPPLEQRERYYEAHELISRAWTADEPFAFNGKYWQLPCVNVWPRPVQDPHPPIWVPGVASGSTWDFVGARLRLHGPDRVQPQARHQRLAPAGRRLPGAGRAFDGREPVPHRHRARPGHRRLDGPDERDYAEHLRYFFSGTTHTPPEHRSRAARLGRVRGRVARGRSGRYR